MEENCTLAPTINFNCWKHHAGFIKKQIESVREINEMAELKVYLLKIGDSLMDLYFGDHSPLQISEQILDYLHQNKIFLFEKYRNWLSKDGKGYQLIELKDKSIWTIRLGENIERYVHIHPGRYSPNTRRVRAHTLKTAIFALCFENLGEQKLCDTELINQIRRNYLNEPPLKSVSKDSGLGKLLELFR